MDKKEMTLILAEKIKSFGYDVYMVENFHPWLIFTDGFNIAYAGLGEFMYYDISSKHKPCKEAGTGINVVDDCVLSNITKDVCEDALSFVPKWYRMKHRNLSFIKKWGVQEFFDKELNIRHNSYVKI